MIERLVAIVQLELECSITCVNLIYNLTAAPLKLEAGSHEAQVWHTADVLNWVSYTFLEPY
jgi:hypothetical protein